MRLAGERERRKFLRLCAAQLAAFFLLGSCSEQPLPPQHTPPWIVYTTSNSPLATNRINNLFIDSQLRVWIATDSGAYALSTTTHSWSAFKDSLRYYAYDSRGIAYPGYSVASVTEAKDGSIWFALKGGGVRRFHPSSQTGIVWTSYSAEVPAYAAGITSYKNDPAGYGEIWVASGSGIDRFDQTDADAGNWKHFDPAAVASAPTNNMVSAFTNKIDDHLWFGAALGGAFEAFYNGNSLMWGEYESPIYQYEVRAIAFDLNHTVWFGKAVGASSLDLQSGRWKFFTPESTHGNFPGGPVNALVTDYHAQRWFGTDSGLVLVEDSSYSRFTRENSPLPDNIISSLAFDLHGNLWIGTRSGLAVFNKSGVRL